MAARLGRAALMAVLLLAMVAPARADNRVKITRPHFGKIHEFTTERETIVVTNTSDETLTVHCCETGGAVLGGKSTCFSSGELISLEPGESCTVVLRITVEDIDEPVTINGFVSIGFVSASGEGFRIELDFKAKIVA